MSDHLENPVESDRLQNESSPVFSANLPFLVLVSVPGSSWHGMTLCEIHLFGARLVTNYERRPSQSLWVALRWNQSAPSHTAERESPRETLQHAQPTAQHTICARQIWSQLLPTLNSPVISAKQKMRAAENEIKWRIWEIKALGKGKKKVWPCMVTHTQIFALHLTHPSADTHTAVSSEREHTHTHPEQWAAIYAAAPGEQLGVRCLAQGLTSVVVLRVERALEPTIPAGPETRTRPSGFCSFLQLSIHLGHYCPKRLLK